MIKMISHMKRRTSWEEICRDTPSLHGKRSLRILLPIALGVLCLAAGLLYQGSLSSAAASKTMISDSAGFLSSEEASQIETACDTIWQRYQTSVFIITTDKLGRSDHYEDYIRKQSEKVSKKDNLIILFLSTKENDDVCKIACYGNIKNSLTSQRIQKIERAVQKKADRGDRYEAIETFCHDMTKWLSLNPALDVPVFRSLFQLIFSLLLGCGVVYCLLRPEKKEAATLYYYLDQNQSKSLGKLDHFSHREVNILREKKKKQE